ncbi:MAG: TonB-dependent siderophore receptor [Hydrogenophaga sp.]|uniref:TonB-dependent siderophore receptor n=1 Tax=Hydrogenophaga sp. TaxID=1904254 RepID=UPI002760BBD5|nr:TonB-dependent siderophore receptor [Hydrogenophaga sp.]MDP2417865.1 TonB-dependent siderophore receptor [Hydrogenophaga sp.]MDZ4188828.1 TonB-dependent siderophore receptor [Hydrogenophaga sp.]
MAKTTRLSQPSHAITAAASHFKPSSAALACLLVCAPGVQAQSTAPAASLAEVVIQSGASSAAPEIGGFADQPLANTPINATLIPADEIAQTGARRLSDLYRLDASVSDAYNAGGYYDYVSVRGFVIDNTYNYRREGLPISAETALPLDHLERVELLKGTSGIQAGTSAPGGLFNIVVKRPTQNTLRSLRLEATNNGNALVHADLGGRLGDNRDVGYRLNLLGERLNSHARGTEGQRGLMALALDARLSPDRLLEGEFEVSRRSQASVPGLSLLGNALPPAEARININTQPWTQPVVFQNFSGSLRYTQAINSDWNWQAQLGTQRLKTDDRLAYPYGCSNENSYDRYCSNGDFDLYDYRSENERRNTTAAQWRINGQLNTGAVQHQVNAGVITSRFTDRGEPRAGNIPLGTGNLFTLPPLAPLANYSDTYTLRTERSTEFFATDVIRWNSQLQTWLGLRHTRLDRASVRTNGSRATDYDQNVTTPWLAATWQLNPAQMAYASWGQGVESEVVPGRPRYSNQGQALPALKSRQWELGLKSDTGTQRWNATVFHITRPVSADLRLDPTRSCSDSRAGSCTRVIDGHARHQGLELGGGRTSGAWSYDASATWIHAERRQSDITPRLNGQRPTNVPKGVLRANLSHALAAVPGLHLGAHLSHEGRRSVLPDASVQLPSWTRVDASLRFNTRLNGRQASWTLTVDNLLDRRYFKESPYQYEHIYLFPGAPRSVRLALQTNF